MEAVRWHTRIVRCQYEPGTHKSAGDKSGDKRRTFIGFSERMSSMWSSHASFRDQELQDLRRRADAAATALESTEKAARSREDNLRISKEELLQDLAK
eukprot:2105378-Amphidinium_carterae.1